MVQQALGLDEGPSSDNRLRQPLRAAFEAVSPAWRAVTDAWLATPAGAALCAAVDARVAAGAVVYPAHPLRALERGGPADVQVVILGQDPYHGPGEAEGLAFSVAPGVRIPPSLRNIHAELQRELGHAPPRHGSLAAWTGQGVLLLNTCLTVEADRPASHARLGWQGLTDAVIAALAADTAPKVFLLWGAHAQARQVLIDGHGAGRHAVLASNHPSPLSARRPPVPFVGSAPFGRADAWLRSQGRPGVDWRLR
ncbi:uracil-DNA glycosylase [Leptothrix discophora]|uniref:Uracil-DNA glycosylase n=1 Tax=Leptothrix discophora TaxID=89 RepID=A0ABT9G920_LEPDI|nr:uracil-DNA glycosylase [Leptothrix discophora]MDP4302956.1 uracil-DNA glycosylase [Leptothrix discophora]